VGAVEAAVAESQGAFAVSGRTDTGGRRAASALRSPAVLANLELKVLYQEWLNAIPQFQIKEDSTPHFHAGVVIGIENLPLEWVNQ
jgi:hypothetical protein